MASREEEQKDGLEKFLWFTQLNIFNPLTLSYESVSSSDNEQRYYPLIIVKSGEIIRDCEALDLDGLKSELRRLQRALEAKEYDIEKVCLPD